MSGLILRFGEFLPPVTIYPTTQKERIAIKRVVSYTTLCRRTIRNTTAKKLDNCLLETTKITTRCQAENIGIVKRWQQFLGKKAVVPVSQNLPMKLGLVQTKAIEVKSRM